MKTNKTLEKLNDYEAFVEKFKPKKTTDDSYTPEYIYDTVLQWLRRNADLEGREIIRPFWPGGDYKAVDYPEGCVVVDNPPFSILAEIKRFYLERGIRFFLFAPHLTLFSTDNAEVSYIIANTTDAMRTGRAWLYGFCDQPAGVCRVRIYRRSLAEKEELESVQRKALQEKGVKKVFPNYAYPSHLVTTSSVAYLINAGITVGFPVRKCCLSDAWIHRWQRGRVYSVPVFSPQTVWLRNWKLRN